VTTDTKAELTRALERLRRRDAEVLAAFILSLAQDSGPIGDQVRTFIVGDDIDATVGSLRERITSLRIPTESAHRHARGKEIGASLGYVLDSIEMLVLPVNPKAAFGLLVRVFETDGVAMENCGDHDFEVSSAFERAAELIGRASNEMPQAEVVGALEALLDDDGYGVRGVLAELIARRGEDP
jgi:uncharacterized protein DUF6880